MTVFERMQQGGYYDVCSDDASMDSIRRNESRIRHDGWRDYYRQSLYDLCPTDLP
jgi:hypothetical protein